MENATDNITAKAIVWNGLETVYDEHMKVIVELLTDIFSEAVTQEEYEIIREKFLEYFSRNAENDTEKFCFQFLSFEAFLQELISEI